ncbi:VanZ family protein [Epilithonimonas xixisoli]|uniref:VanZ like protein n=1 Tax=Epilithonimonas xixisoli TaxID=1476462 RepID=A0A4R8I8F9_9FLAO|nr:VanZ family protein [Epilithonimonas xixisoli]TDX82902.1 VanZ like protein [Epilithonimonas xixisoli]
MLKKFLNLYYPPLINIYTIWILYMMFFAYGRDSIDSNHYFINSIPFETIYQLIVFSGEYPYENLSNIFGNIILFMPYGFLGILYPKLNSYRYLLVVFLVVINILEFSQYYFNRGFAELDDVMLNTLGMSLGFIIYKKWFIITDK